ncbi:MAG TPA: FAD-dependent oxidoreductase [Devosia sp.]|jgi:pyruvate/2-oxoglutarate dehydrogenase complex dihydrolipoamide dehydrogenase (E3) component|nr:FAD-dependent oxidoreductase [Devosia sp.]
MADVIKPDLCVIGAGALGIELALHGRQRGLGVALVDVPGVDAVDPAQGALRRAAFLASAARAQAIRTAGAVGVDAPDPKPNFRVIGEHAASVAASAEPRDARERLVALGVTVLSGAAGFVDRRTLRCGDDLVRAGHFALATGATPFIPPLPGLDQVPFFTADTIEDNIRKLSHLVVIGGAPAALELAQAYRRLGSMVTLVPQGGLLQGFDPELVAVLLRTLREEGVVVREDAEVTAILPRSQGTGVALQAAGSAETVDASHILIAMGRVPVLDQELLDPLKLRRDRLRPDHLLLGPRGQTSNRRLSAIGGAAGQHQPTVATRQADLLVEWLLGRGNGRLDPHYVPSIVMTQPVLAQVGMEARQALRPGQTVLRANLAETDGARAMGQAEGSVRLVVNRGGTISGAGALGASADQTMALLALAMARGLGLRDLAGLALPPGSTAAALVDLARHHLAQQPPPSGWRRRLRGAGNILP